jgi:hypothetical protein
MKKILLLSVLAVLLYFTPALAQGPYIGAGLVYNDPLGSDINYLRPGPGLDFRFGYDFGPVALEGNLMGSSHNDTDPGYGYADFEGFSLDLKVFLSRTYAPDQVYLLAGIGSYSLYEYDPFLGTDTQLNGTGWNFGAGLEHYVNTNFALSFGVTYRIIRYDEFDAGGAVFSLRPRENGDTITYEFGFNYHF